MGRIQEQYFRGHFGLCVVQERQEMCSMRVRLDPLQLLNYGGGGGLKIVPS